MSGFLRRFRSLFLPRPTPAKVPIPSATQPSAEEWGPEDARVVERAARADDPWAAPLRPTPTPGSPVLFDGAAAPLPDILASDESAPAGPLLSSLTASPAASAHEFSAPHVSASSSPDTSWVAPEFLASLANPDPNAAALAARLTDTPAHGAPVAAGEIRHGVQAPEEFDIAAPSLGLVTAPVDIDTDWDVPGFTDPGSPKADNSAGRDDTVPHADPAFGLDLPDYDPDLSQHLGSEEWSANSPAASRARGRAAQIVALLDVTTRQQQVAARAWLEAFFARRPAASTFRAIERAALDGLDLPTLNAMDALREAWEQRPEWWVCRILRPWVLDRATSTARAANGDTALTWTMARRICLARAELPPEDMIDPDWLNEWYVLPRERRSPVSFAQYVDEKVTHQAAWQLHAGFQNLARWDDPSERFDRRGWHRELPDPGDGPPLSLQMTDPTERHVEKKDEPDD